MFHPCFRHLAEFSSDDEAWTCLAQLYLTQACISQAIFCYEEVFLHNAQSPALTITLAELLVSTKQYAEGLRYYFIALHQCPDNLRALWGIVWTINSVCVDPLAIKSFDKKKKTEMQEAQAVCCRQLRYLYGKPENANDFSKVSIWNSLCCAILEDLNCD